VFCVLSDKDWRRMLRLLAPVVSRFVLTRAPSAPAERAWDVEAAMRFADEAKIPSIVVRDFDEALEQSASLGETVLVTGSFHTVGDAMARLQVSPLSG
jgi:dihydrofolate synthase / folylpolyglutamate synthase